MLNRSGIIKNKLTSPMQILANVELQGSVGCMVPQSMGVAVGTQKIAKAGTPIKVDFTDLSKEVEAASATVACNAVLLHDVDVTAGSANGTALYFGVVNLNRMDADVQALYATEGLTVTERIIPVRV